MQGDPTNGDQHLPIGKYVSCQNVQLFFFNITPISSTYIYNWFFVCPKIAEKIVDRYHNVRRGYYPVMGMRAVFEADKNLASGVDGAAAGAGAASEALLQVQV